MKALIIGATGATGSDLLDILLADQTWEQIDIFVKRPVDIKNARLNIHIIDFDNPEDWKPLVRGDVLFSCLGTTLKAAGSKEAQWKVDYDYQYTFAKSARENGVPSMVLVSALQASIHSRFFYSKMKGRLELDIKALHFPKLIIFRPSLLIRKNSDRKGEKIFATLIRFANKIGLLHQHKPMSTRILAMAMVQALLSTNEETLEIEGQKIRDYV